MTAAATWQPGSGSGAFAGTPRLVRQTAGFSFGHWQATPVGDDIAEHAHVQPHFMFIVGGRFATSAAGSAVRSPLIYNPANTVHRDRFESPDGRFFAVSAESAQVADNELRWTAPHRIESVRFHAIVMRLMRECRSWNDDSPEVAASLCIALFAGEGASRDYPRPAWLLKAVSMLREGLEKPVTIASLAEDLGVHRTHLTRMFLRAYGCTPAEFARLHRIRRAAGLLAATCTPIAEIALACGFTDQSHFSTHFRRAWGIAPGQYRRLTR